MLDMVRRSCREMNKENDVAISYFGTRFTYKELFAQVDRYAAAFAHYGIKEGDYVTLLTVSIPESLFSIYALNRLGAVCNFIDVRTDAVHVREYIKKAGSHVLITLEQAYEAVADYLDDLDLRLVICQTPARWMPLKMRIFFRLKAPGCSVPYDGRRVIRDEDFVRAGEGKTAPEVSYKPDMPAVITRTGGTTGLSKGVVLTNDSMNAIAWNFKASCMDRVPRERSLLNFLPLGSSYGIAVGVHMALCLGCEDILVPKFKPEDFDKLILQYRPNHIIAVPAFYQQLISSPRLKNKDLSFIHTMAAGGDTANDALEDKLENFRLAHGIPYPVSQGYGLSEVSSAASFGFQNIHKKGSAGIPSLTTVIAAFRPGTAEELPLGEKGELCISGATVMKSYLREPEETHNVLWRHDDGNFWIHTGDIGYVDEDGFVYIVGRIKRAITRFDGHKVYPLQLERTVMEHPSVKNCVAVAVRDRDHEQGYLPLLVVETEEGVSDSKELRHELLAHCRREIELRSQPADVIFEEKIPLTNICKNDYRALEVEYGFYDYRRK